MRLPSLLIALSLCLAAGLAQAAKPVPPEPESVADCSKQDLAQVDLNVCAYGVFKKQDRALNALYGELMKTPDAGEPRQLQASQRAWLQFRDLECAYEVPDTGGSIVPTLKADCLAELTRERILDLRRVLNNKPD